MDAVHSFHAFSLSSQWKLKQPTCQHDDDDVHNARSMSFTLKKGMSHCLSRNREVSWKHPKSSLGGNLSSERFVLFFHVLCEERGGARAKGKGIR